MKTKVRSGRGTGPLPSPPPLQPAVPSHSAAERAAYTEAHQSTHIRPSGQDTHERRIGVVTMLKQREERGRVELHRAEGWTDSHDPDQDKRPSNHYQSNTDRNYAATQISLKHMENSSSLLQLLFLHCF